MAPQRDPLTLPHRDETRTAYILQAVESAWEGADRRKAPGAKDPPVAEDLNGVVATAEPVRGLASHPENSERVEVRVSGVACSPRASPSRLRLRGWGSRKPPFFVSALREKRFLLGWAPRPAGQPCAAFRESWAEGTLDSV